MHEGLVAERMQLPLGAMVEVQLGGEYTARVFASSTGEARWCVMRWLPTRAGKLRFSGWFELNTRGVPVPRVAHGKGRGPAMRPEWFGMMGKAAAHLASPRRRTKMKSVGEVVLGVRVRPMVDNPMR